MRHKRSPQAAIDAPRFRLVHDGGIAVEYGHPLADTATSRRLVDHPGEGGFGAAQIAATRPDGSADAGADPRRGGKAVLLALPPGQADD